MKQALAQAEIVQQGHVDDAALVARISKGDQIALARFIERHGRGVTLFAQRYLGNAADADEAAQDVFVALWKQAQRYDPAKAKVSTWLYRITVNRCIDMYRRRKFMAFIGLDDVQETMASPQPLADAHLEAREDVALVRAGLNTLPERQRMALLLRAIADLDVPAIAEVMKTSPGSVEQLLVRGRRSLRHHVETSEKNTQGQYT